MSLTARDQHLVSGSWCTAPVARSTEVFLKYVAREIPASKAADSHSVLVSGLSSSSESTKSVNSGWSWRLPSCNSDGSKSSRISFHFSDNHVVQ